MHTAQLALFAWIPFVLCLFTVLQPRHAVIAAYVGGWLFLPVFGIDVKGLPPFTKVSATAYGVLFGALLFDLDRVQTFRLKWFDLPMVVWCIAPLFASGQLVARLADLRVHPVQERNAHATRVIEIMPTVKFC